MPLLRADPFSMPAVLLSSPDAPSKVSDEQKMYIREILETACSDSRFAEKAYLAISAVLLSGQTKTPVITSLTPNSAEIGDPSFTLHVHGSNFTNTSQIMFNGGEEPTTFVGPTEVTTIVNMDTVSGPVTVPVSVVTGSVVSLPSSFTFTDGSSLSALGIKGKEKEKEVTGKFQPVIIDKKEETLTEKVVEKSHEEKKKIEDNPKFPGAGDTPAGKDKK